MRDPISRLRADFIARCREDRQRLAKASPGDEVFVSITHRLAGAAGSFGFLTLSEAAAAVDQSIRSGKQPGIAKVDALMRELARVAEISCSPACGPPRT